MDGLEFQLDIEQRLRGGEALTQLEKLEAAYTDAKIANQNFSREALKTESALEKVTSTLGDTKAALLAAIKAGDPAQIQKLTTKYHDLETQQTKLTAQLKTERAEWVKSDAQLQKHASMLGKAKDGEKQLEAMKERSDTRNELYTRNITKLTGRVGESAETLSKMGSELGTLGTLASLAVVGTVALIAAVVAAVVAFGAAAVAVYKYAIELANAKRNQEQTLRALTQSNEGAKQTSDSFNEITKATGIGSAELLNMTRQLTYARTQMGLAAFSGDRLTTALKTAATAQQALDDPSAGQAVIDQLNAGMYTVDQLADRVDKKYGDVVKQKMLGLDQQMTKLRANIAGIFAHFDITPFLVGLSRLVDLFDTTTASGKAIQALFDAVFGKSAGTAADRFFIGIERWVLKTELAILVLAIKFKAAWKKINEAIDSVDLGPLGSLRSIITGLEGPTERVAMWLLGMLNPMIAISQIGGAFESGIGLVGKALKSTYDTGVQWVTKIANFGSDIIDGIEQGLKNGEQRLVSTFNNVLNSVHLGGQKTIEAHSPSRRAARELGEPIGQGVAEGIQSTSGDVSAALDSMLALPAAPAAGGGGGSSSSLTNSGNTYNFHGVKDAADAGDKFFENLIEAFDRLADQGGTESPA